MIDSRTARDTLAPMQRITGFGWAAAIALTLAIAGCSGETEETIFPSSTSTSSSSSGSFCPAGKSFACACPAGDQGTTTCAADGSAWGPCEGCAASSSSSSSSSGGGGGAGGGGCASPAECPGEDTSCAARTCMDGVCGIAFMADGELLGDDEQLAGDCSSIVCDGAGGTRAEPDALDVDDDANDCTADTCGPNGPEHVMLPKGNACSTGLCDAGACVPFIPVVCNVDGDLYIGCDGVDHQWQIMFDTGMPQLGGCLSVTDVGFCAPGTGCSVFLTLSQTIVDGSCM